ncbi:MAG: SDR family oxidoreductase [Bryobacteraceae bacterium]
MILITGASGSAGGAVLEAAVAAGSPLRAMYRSNEDARKTPKNVGAVVADFADKSSLRNALRGIESVYLVCGPVPQLVELEGNMIDACKEANVRHIVLNSALGAGDFQKSFPSWHFEAERKLKDSGLAYTILRPNGFMQNIVTYNAGSIRAQGAFYAAMGDAKISMIDVRDIGAAAAGILLDPAAHAGKTYQLNGPEAVSNFDIAERISRVAGRKVSYVDIPEEAQRKGMLDVGMPEWLVTAVLQLQEYYRSGRCATVDGAVAKLTGRPERTLDQYLVENAASFQSQAAAT